MNEKSKGQLKGLAVAVAGVFAVANGVSSEAGPLRLLLYAAIVLVYVAAPYWWPRLEGT